MLAFLIALSSSAYIKSFEERSFLRWMRENNCFYTGKEYSFRLGLFLTSSRFISEWNRGNKGSRLSLNKFATYTPAEKRYLLSNTHAPGIPEKYLKYSKKPVVTVKDIPASLDFRDQGIVNKVKDSAQCGAGWAFAAISSIESCWALQKGTLYVLSEQNLIDCMWNCENCNDGQSDWALYQIISDQNGTVNLETDYPYTGIFSNECYFKPDLAVTKMTGVYNLPIGKPDEMAALLYENGPIAASMDADHISFYYYSGGVYDDPECNPWGINHFVTIIGYGTTEDNVNYWLCRNCWGTGWGEDGYFKIKKDTESVCGIDIVAVLPQF